MTNFEERGNAIIARIWADVQRADREHETEMAAKNPKAYKNSQVMQPGARLNYTYFESKTAVRGQVTRWCYAKSPNVAGYYLSWIEVWKKNSGQRFNFHGHENKKTAIEDCRARYNDTARPVAERRFTIPKMKARKS